MVEYLNHDYGFTIQESLERIYHSQLYKKLSTESTKYWQPGGPIPRAKSGATSPPYRRIRQYSPLNQSR